MKRLFLISTTFMIASAAFAQTNCSADNSLFKFDNVGATKEIYTLGSAPEFPFLRNLSSPQQVYSAIKKNEQKNTRGVEQLNDLLTAAGFGDGVKDLKSSDITAYYIPPGTEGNMGSAGYSNGYYKLSGDAENFKAWKFSSGTGCYVYILAKCGNAFFPKTQKATTACIVAPVNLTGDMKEVTLNSSGQKLTTTDNVYVYYHRRRHKKKEMAHSRPEIADAYPSRPILLRSTSDVTTVPETYKVTVNTPDNTIKVCPDSVVSLTANINVEKTSEYTGNYPDKDQKQYKKVSKRVYRKTARKMRKVDRKENRVASLTGVAVKV